MGFHTWAMLGLVTGLLAKFFMPVDRRGGLRLCTFIRSQNQISIRVTN